MKRNRLNIQVVMTVFVASLLSAVSVPGATVFLRTGVVTNTMPDGQQIVMWGFAKENAFGAKAGKITVPGPELTVPVGDNRLIIYLDNNLPEPVSLMIPGLQSNDGAPLPTRAGDGRATSFIHETAPGNTTPVKYSWTNVTAGTHMYLSGSHPSIQVQMGLYGAVKKDAALQRAYAGVPYTKAITLLFGEIDPAIHAAVATGNYGANKAITSTVNYRPKYFTINGLCYTNGQPPIASVQTGGNVLLRLLNAGSQSHVPIVNGGYLRLIAEDGFPYAYEKNQYSVFLAAGKTMDVIFRSVVTNRFALYDRTLNLVNGVNSPGGMLTYIDVSGLPRWQLSTTIAPSNGGTVVARPSPQPDSLYLNGTVVKLTEQPKPPFTFINWTGDRTGTAESVTVAMTADRNVTANFMTNLLLPSNGGVLNSYTSQYSAKYGAIKLTDGYVTSLGTFWISNPTSAVPQGFVYSFSNHNSAVMSLATIYNYGQGIVNNGYSKGFSIEASSNGTSFTVITNGVLAANTSAQTFGLGNTVAKYVRLVITDGYNASYRELREFRVFGAVIADTNAPVPGTATSPAATNASPIIVSYTGASDTGGSALDHVELWYKKNAVGTWLNSGLTQTGASGSFSFTGMAGTDRYYFALVAVDGAGNRSPAVSGAGDCSTDYTGLLTQINLVLPANGGVLRSFTSQFSATYGAAKLTDGITGATGFWRSGAFPAVPQTFVYSFNSNSVAALNNAVVYNYGEGTANRYSKDFHIAVSSDGINYTVITNGVLASNETAQLFDLRGMAGRFVRLVVTSGNISGSWELSEFQVYGGLVNDQVPPVLGTASSPATTNASPIIVTYAGVTDIGGAGLASVELWYKRNADGLWSNSGLIQTGASGSFNFTGMTGVDTYYFGLVAVDGAGNRSPAVSGAGDCSTVYTGTSAQLNLISPANGGILRSFTSQLSATYGAAKLTDGLTGAASFWMSSALPAVPQSFVYSFSNNSPAALSQAVVYNYGQGAAGRYSKGFHIDVSSDGINYAVITNGVLASNETAQVFDLRGMAGRFVRLVVTNGYAASYRELSEFQVYGAFSGPVPLSINNIRLMNSDTAASETDAEESWPQVWSSSAWSPRYLVENVVDGNTNTAWVGMTNAAPWIVSVDYGVKTNLTDLQIMFWEQAWTNIFVGGSINGSNDWFNVLSSTNQPFEARYLIIEMMNDTNRDVPPIIREIMLK